MWLLTQNVVLLEFGTKPFDALLPVSRVAHENPHRKVTPAKYATRAKSDPNPAAEKVSCVQRMLMAFLFETILKKPN